MIRLRGSPARMALGRRLSAEPAEVRATGTPAGMLAANTRRLRAESGSVTVEGDDSQAIVDYRLHAEDGDLGELTGGVENPGSLPHLILGK